MATRKMIINDKECYFNLNIFNFIFMDYKIKNNLKIGELEGRLANFVNKDSSTIHNWRNLTSGPSDLETIQLIAKFFEIEDYKLLFNEENESMKKLSDLQMLSVKRIYDMIMDYLEEFDKSDGFNNYWHDLKVKPEDRQGVLYDIALGYVDKIILVYKKEYLFLKNTEIYEKIGNFIYNDLYETFENKLSYAYRFEAEVSGNPSTYEDYYKALSTINQIIDKYM